MSGIIYAGTQRAANNDAARDLVMTLVTNSYIAARIKAGHEPPEKRSVTDPWSTVPGPVYHQRCVLVGRGIDVEAVQVDDPVLRAPDAGVTSMTLFDVLSWRNVITSYNDDGTDETPPTVKESEDLGICSEAVFSRYRDDYPEVGHQLMKTIQERYDAAPEQQRSLSDKTKRIITDNGGTYRDPVSYRLVDDVEISLDKHARKRGYA